jgi:endo-1,4-beta-xylanase
MSTRITLFTLLLVSSATLMGWLFKDKPFLKDAYKDKFLIGVAMNRPQANHQKKEEVDLIKKHFNSIVAENDMKWGLIHPQKDQYNFEHADKLVAFGQENNMFVVGHALIWHSQLAPWVFKADDGTTIDRAELEKRMQDHIQTIVARYKGKVHGWDVVNEALAEDGTLRNSQFLQVGGETFIEKAFEFAHKANPNVELYYNDYNLVYAAKRDGAIRIIKNLKEKGLRIDAVGIQGHWGLTYPSLEEIETAIEMYAAEGVKVMITELDISALPSPFHMPTADVSVRFQNSPTMNPYPDGLPDSVQTQLAERYADVFRIFNKHADKISRVTLWGLHDGISWKNNFPIRGRTDYPLLFDRKLHDKKALDAVIKTASE